MEHPIVVSLCAYYIKSCQGTQLQHAVLGPQGIEHDREWMIVDANSGEMVTQREVAKLACVLPILTDTGLTVKAPGQRQTSVTVPRALWRDGDKVTVRVWKDECQAIDQGGEINRFLSGYCERPVRLVRMADNHLRPTKGTIEGENPSLGFADAYLLSLTSLASLRELNRRAGVTFSMDCFRPNVVVDLIDSEQQLEPFAEDTWNEFAINGMRFRGVKPCFRCQTVTINQRTGLRTYGNALTALSEFRREQEDKGKILFGMNLNYAGTGTISVGQAVTNIVLGPRPLT